MKIAPSNGEIIQTFRLGQNKTICVLMLPDSPRTSLHICFSTRFSMETELFSRDCSSQASSGN
ncbi:hypothetical protein SynPROS91_02110 [Synechococcus sp. PROS-9-1]|nr:hypothetical protein SynPROS91_02110 [Synechococcus sp. PROS-9-1]